MRLAKEYEGQGATIDYLLEVGGGMAVTSTMPATVALEICRNAGSLATCERDGAGWLRADERQLFPLGAFDLEGAEVPEEAPRGRRRGCETAKAG